MPEIPTSWMAGEPDTYSIESITALDNSALNELAAELRSSARQDVTRSTPNGVPLVSTIPPPLRVLPRDSGCGNCHAFAYKEYMKKQKHRVVRNPKTDELFVETPGILWDERHSVWMTDHSQPCPMPMNHRMFRFPLEYGYERMPDVKVQIDTFPTTVSAVEKAEREFEGEDFCICDHQRKYHRAAQGECASCGCAAFLSPEAARKFYIRTKKVPAEIDGSAYTKALVSESHRHPA